MCSSSPLRGAATGQARLAGADPRFPIAPKRGSKHQGEVASPSAGAGPVPSSPLRGAATGCRPRLPLRVAEPGFLIAPKRGSNISSVELIQNDKGIQVPESIAEASPHNSVVVMVTKDDLFVQGEHIASIAEVKAAPGSIVGPLRDALKRPLLVGAAVAEQDLAKREITIMADKALPYEVLKKVMATCTDADYGRISLAVLQKEKPVVAGQFTPS